MATDPQSDSLSALPAPLLKPSPLRQQHCPRERWLLYDYLGPRAEAQRRDRHDIGLDVPEIAGDERGAHQFD